MCLIERNTGCAGPWFQGLRRPRRRKSWHERTRCGHTCSEYFVDRVVVPAAEIVVVEAGRAGLGEVQAADMVRHRYPSWYAEGLVDRLLEDRSRDVVDEVARVVRIECRRSEVGQLLFAVLDGVVVVSIADVAVAVEVDHP